jgi:hypothetical protein
MPRTIIAGPNDYVMLLIQGTKGCEGLGILLKSGFVNKVVKDESAADKQ